MMMPHRVMAMSSRTVLRPRSLTVVRSWLDPITLCSPAASALGRLSRTSTTLLSSSAIVVRSFFGNSSSSSIHENISKPQPKPQQQSCHAGSGLFSIPELQTPHDFVVLTKQAFDECNRLRSSVAATVGNNGDSATLTRPEMVRLLHQLDDISKSVCNVIDAAELCRNVHADPLWREAADTAFEKLADYMTLLNADTTLYQALQLVTKSKSRMSLLSEEDLRFATLLQAEFERDGIHLSDGERDQVRDWQNQIVQLESTFLRNLIHSGRSFVVQKDPASVAEVIPWDVLESMGAIHLAPNPDDPDQSSRAIRLENNDNQILPTLLKYSANPALRKEIYYEHMTAVPENLQVLPELQRVRHALAVTQGFASYAQRHLQDKLLPTPVHVQNFLQAAATANRDGYRRDMERLAHAKQQVEGNSTIEPWDTAFYTGLVTARDCGDVSAALAQHFSQEAVLYGMQVLVDRLFGIQMTEQSLTESERWDVPTSGPGRQQQQPQASTKLRKFSFHSLEGRPLGTMFLDLHPRPDKYGHAAHFTVRCGCAIHEYGDDESKGNDNTEYQLPIIALVCNLTSSSSDHGLAHSEVETLFHEFGHALHSLLSRTQYQHMSGTRAAMDFVETPSHLMEHFCWDVSFVQTALAERPLPDDLVQRWQQSRHQFAGLERQNQILYAQMDQQLFGVPTDSAPEDLFAKLHRDYEIPYMPGTHWFTKFGHLVSYGAGYYGYLYAQMVARDIWNTCFLPTTSTATKNPASRQAGTWIWNGLLQHGGARDPQQLLRDVLGGRPPRVDFSLAAPQS